MHKLERTLNWLKSINALDMIFPLNNMALLIAMHCYDHYYVKKSWCQDSYCPGLTLKEKYIDRYKGGTQIIAYNENFQKLCNICLCCFWFVIKCFPHHQICLQTQIPQKPRFSSLFSLLRPWPSLSIYWFSKTCSLILRF